MADVRFRSIGQSEKPKVMRLGGKLSCSTHQRPVPVQSAVMYSIVETAKSKQSEYFPIPLYGTPVYAGLHEFVRRYRAADAME